MEENEKARQDVSRSALYGLTARQVLQSLNAWARYASRGDTRNLWAVLTALRGPDNGNDHLKQDTTCRIRAVVYNLAAFHARADTTYKTPNLDLAIPDHFRAHISEAQQALNAMGIRNGYRDPATDDFASDFR